MCQLANTNKWKDQPTVNLNQGGHTLITTQDPVGIDKVQCG